MLVVSILIVSCLCRDNVTSWNHKALQAADDGVPSVTYPRATWRLQAEQEAVPVCEEEKT